ncbi:MAG TPA: O-methyltransferase [Solirubrobacteraceae bacterium]
MIGRVRVRAARWLSGETPASAEELWSAVDSYIRDRLIPQDPVLDAALAASDASGLPPIATSAAQGKLLELLARAHGARRILELGTLGAYSTIWLARSLPPDGELITLEADPRNARVAESNIQAAGFGQIVQLRLGPALETLPKLAAEGTPFDLIFIDADKRNDESYLEWSLKLSRPGSVIIVDNVVGAGAIIDPNARNPWGEEGGVDGVRRFYDRLGAETRLDATVIQTVGEKGHDGFALAIVK